MRAKKNLGQHFLKAPHVIRRMISTANVCADDVVIEIGSGKGVLTDALLNTGATVIAYEKDADLIEGLSLRFERQLTSGQLVLVPEDIRASEHQRYLNSSYKVVANIPYYITGELIRYFLATTKQPTSLTLLIQKEVAERVIARDGKESVLSLSVKVFGTPQYVEKVPARYFTPAPKVDSALIHINAIAHHLSTKDEDTFFTILKQGFAHKRKLLLQNLRPIVTCEDFDACLVHRSARAEDLTLQQWLCLSQRIGKK